MIKLYDTELSANAHKCRMLLSMLGLDYERVEVNLQKGEHKTPEFLAMNPLGQVPVLTDGDATVRDSGAILVYLAMKYGDENWLPREPAGMAEIIAWLSFSANEINNGVTIARFAKLTGDTSIDLDTAQRRGGRSLKTLDAWLADRDWLALGRPTIADIACYPYIALAGEGEVRLDGRDNVIAWIGRVQDLPGWVPMTGLPYKVA
ncbi:MAG: glutathione S-transferase family protein [Alphaproteobacteria bacterium]|nr:glutathione S-transferase family protein [Alphaproteobacteria bacterium]